VSIPPLVCVTAPFTLGCTFRALAISPPGSQVRSDVPRLFVLYSSSQSSQYCHILINIRFLLLEYVHFDRRRSMSCHPNTTTFSPSSHQNILKSETPSSLSTSFWVIQYTYPPVDSIRESPLVKGPITKHATNTYSHPALATGTQKELFQRRERPPPPKWIAQEICTMTLKPRECDYNQRLRQYAPTTDRHLMDPCRLLNVQGGV